MKYPDRYKRNQIISMEEQKELKEKKVLVLGCGGLGGYVIEMLARMGVGHITCSDFDTFSESNLNRQLLSKESNLGKNKAEEASKRVNEINSEVEVKAYTVKGDKDMLYEMIEDCDLVMDCLDTVRDRLVLQDMCKEKGVPLVHGAIGGWFGQVSTILPGNDTLNLIYPDGTEPDTSDGNPSFTPAVVAGLEVSEAIKVLLGYEDILQRKLLVLDLYSNEYQVVEL